MRSARGTAHPTQGSRSLNAAPQSEEVAAASSAVTATNCCEKYAAKWVPVFLLQGLASSRSCSRLGVERLPFRLENEYFIVNTMVVVNVVI